MLSRRPTAHHGGKAAATCGLPNRNIPHARIADYRAVDARHSYTCAPGGTTGDVYSLGAVVRRRRDQCLPRRTFITRNFNADISGDVVGCPRDVASDVAR